METSERQFSHLVVVGASAGGIESLSVLVSTLPPTFSAPIVIAQHLSPNRISALADILARRGPLPVHTIQGRQALEPGVIYVVPPNRNVMITDHEVELSDDVHGPQPSIDLLFTSASEIFQENLIAVVLSGTGSDGAAGARQVKYAGGTVIIQNPETAAYPGMPLSLAASVVDIVANREHIGELLTELVEGTFVVPPITENSQLRAFLDELRDQSGIDFTSYKQATIERRLQRRMVVTGQGSITDYIRYVQTNPKERRQLVTSFLIKVTEFFRDPEVFAYLKEHVLSELIREAEARESDLRIWSAGCATGEEAYSLAMMVADIVEEEQLRLNIRIFATDLDADAVSFARRGMYPARLLGNLDPSLLERHFTKHGDDYEVNKLLRGMVVFGEHDLGQRAPFPRIDLILCRNVLIYFTSSLQRRALQLFAFSLRTGGYLVVGKSETVSPLAEFFTLDQPRLKVFSRMGNRALIPPSRIREVTPVATSALTVSSAAGLNSPIRFAKNDRESSRAKSVRHSKSVLLLGVPFGIVMVDQDYDIQYINSEARHLFGIHSTALEHDLIHLIQRFDSQAVRKSIDAARSSGTESKVLLSASHLDNEMQQTLEITCMAIQLSEDQSEALTLVTAIDVTEREQLKSPQSRANELFGRLGKANEEVLAANQEMTVTITKLRADNEELLVASEEIQAATEEVETLNEELQASNEELETLNEELQSTVEELNTTNDDLQARTGELQTFASRGGTARLKLHRILDGINMAVAVVDKDGSILLKNDAYLRVFEHGGTEIELLDEEGLPLVENAPIRRAARGEEFHVICGMNLPQGIVQYLVEGIMVLPSTEDQAIVISFHETEPKPDSN